MEPLEGKMEGMPSPVTVSTKLQKVAELAKQAPEMAITSLSHHIDIDFLYEAYHRTRKDGAESGRAIWTLLMPQTPSWAHRTDG